MVEAGGVIVGFRDEGHPGILGPDEPDESSSRAASAVGSTDRKVLQHIRPTVSTVACECDRFRVLKHAYGRHHRKNVCNQTVQLLILLPGRVPQ